MSFDAFTLKSIASELNALLSKGRIEKVLQPSKDEIFLSVHKENAHYKLQINAGAAAPRIGITEESPENPKVPPMFCMLLRKHLTGAKIERVFQHGFERVVEIEQIKNDTKQYEFNKFQYNELKNANLVVGEIEEIENELSYLNNFENISNLLNQIKSRLKHDNILDGIYDLTNDLNKMAEYDEKYSNYIEKLDSIYYELEDLGHNVTSDLNGLEYGEEKLNDLNERVVYLNSLKKKYHLSIEELIEYQVKLENNLKKFSESPPSTLPQHKLLQAKYKIKF